MQKTKFIFMLSCLLVAGALSAQVALKGGVSFSGVGSYGNSEDGETFSFKPGFQVGALYQLGLTDKVGLQVELNYEQKGTISKKDYSINYPVQDPSTGMVLGVGQYDIKQEANSAQHYINLPLLLVFGEGNFQFYVGPHVGYMLSGTAEFDRTIDITLGGNPAGSSTVELKEVDWFEYEEFKAIFVSAPEEDGDFLNRLDVGINVGATYYLTDSFFADLRVSQGLTDVSNNHYDNSIYPDQTTFTFPSREDTDRLLSIQLSAGYRF